MKVNCGHFTYPLLSLFNFYIAKIRKRTREGENAKQVDVFSRSHFRFVTVNKGQRREMAALGFHM